MPEGLHPDPVDDAVRVNTPDEWDTLLEDQRTLGETELVPFNGLPAAGGIRLLSEQVEDVLAVLSDEERRAMKLWFGLIDGSAKTNAQIGEDMGVSEEVAESLVAGAIDKIRNPSGYR